MPVLVVPEEEVSVVLRRDFQVPKIELEPLAIGSGEYVPSVHLQERAIGLPRQRLYKVIRRSFLRRCRYSHQEEGSKGPKPGHLAGKCN